MSDFNIIKNGDRFLENSRMVNDVIVKKASGKYYSNYQTTKLVKPRTNSLSIIPTIDDTNQIFEKDLSSNGYRNMFVKRNISTAKSSLDYKLSKPSKIQCTKKQILMMCITLKI